MANSTRHEPPLRSTGAQHHDAHHHDVTGHRIDEVHVHERKQKSRTWAWLLLLAGALMVLWGVFARKEARPVVTACDAATLSFGANSATIASSDRGALQALASCLKANPTAKVRLQGHASAAEGTVLAQSRAEAVGRALRAKGVPSAQFSVGVVEAICVEPTESCELKNRSVLAVPLRRE